MSSSPTAPTSTPIQAVSFDLDGTLYGTGPHRLRLMPRLLPQLGLIRAWSSAVKGHRDRPYDGLGERIIEATAARMGTEPGEARARLWFFLERTWIPGLRPAHLLPGVLDAITLLDARGIPRAVASDHPVPAKLARLGLATGWSALLDGEAVGALKPHPRVLLEAASTMGCPPAALLHIGDRHDTDGEAARAAGARYLHALDAQGSTATLPQRLAALLDAPPPMEHSP
jgi:FMN phosphatase YigB (HAD superfamily)